MGAIEGNATKRMDLNFKLFKGVSIKFKDVETAEESAAQLAESPAVKNVWQVKLFPSPQHTVHSTGGVAGNALSRRQAGGDDTFSPHVMTQVDQLRAKGITGKGIKIAVIDTGVSGTCISATYYADMTIA